MASKEPATFKGHPLLDPKHEKDIHLASAINEFHRGMDRESAEAEALSGYRKEHHAKAAAHHLNSMKASNATGSTEDAKRHYDMYALHLKALGHEPHEAVPPEVKRHMEEGHEGAHTYKGHPADAWLVNGSKN